MNGRVARILKMEATPNHPYKELKKEYMEHGRKQSPKFKTTKRSKRQVEATKHFKRKPAMKPTKFLKSYAIPHQHK